jgi:C-terminal processing protease CtpA/Prc
LVGEESAGYYSDSIPKLLPGGFCFGMSTERYLGADDLMLEGKGVISDIVIPINANDTEQGRTRHWIMC